MKRTLTLRAEVLGALTEADLREVAAGAVITTPINTCVICVTQPSDCICVTQRATQCC